MKYRNVLIAAIGINVASCAGPTELKPRFAPTELRSERIASSGNCDLAINVEDRRVRSSTNYKNISQEKAVEWIDGALDYINTKTPIVNTVENGGQITLSLEKAYIAHMSSAKSGVVVISVSQNETKKYYRGRDTGVNWWGTSTEYHSALNQALEKALVEFIKDEEFEIACQVPA